MSIEIIDAALAEFTKRNSVPSATIINPISTIDPVCADELRRYVSKVHNDPGVLHIRDALNILLDLRNALRDEIEESAPDLEEV